MSERPIRVLFVCRGNSARSIMAEALLRQLGGPRFEVSSAGTEPSVVNPLTIRALEAAGIGTSGLRSKSVDEFRTASFDYVITVCDTARRACPTFPGDHERLHWGYDDPAEATGADDERYRTFERVMAEIAGRLRLFIPIATTAHLQGSGRPER